MCYYYKLLHNKTREKNIKNNLRIITISTFLLPKMKDLSVMANGHGFNLLQIKYKSFIFHVSLTLWFYFSSYFF